MTAAKPTQATGAAEVTQLTPIEARAAEGSYAANSAPPEPAKSTAAKTTESAATKPAKPTTAKAAATKTAPTKVSSKSFCRQQRNDQRCGCQEYRNPPHGVGLLNRYALLNKRKRMTHSGETRISGFSVPQLTLRR
jgi:hypothetical protein